MKVWLAELKIPVAAKEWLYPFFCESLRFFFHDILTVGR